MIVEKERLQKTINSIDVANSHDPNKELLNGEEYPKELLYSIRMTCWLDKIEPGASEELSIAARAQHIQRWKIPRRDYPMDREGYKKWRKVLMDFHAEITGDIMSKNGYGKESVYRVKSLIKKEKFKTDYESQVLEDVVCLVFLENYFAEFSREHKHDIPKMNRIITKTWNKMSDKGRALALELDISEEARALILEALHNN